MSKILASLSLGVLMLGVVIAIFLGNGNGLNQKVIDGHGNLSEKIRKYDYVTN